MLIMVIWMFLFAVGGAGYYIYRVAVAVPAEGRRVQATVWRALAENLVSMELPGVCTDRAKLEKAIDIVGRMAANAFTLGAMRMAA
jgi:hypothetical protein